MNFIDSIEKITASNHAYVLDHVDDATVILTELMVPITLCKNRGCSLTLCGIPASQAMLMSMNEHQLRATLMMAVNALSEIYIAIDMKE